MVNVYFSKFSSVDKPELHVSHIQILLMPLTSLRNIDINILINYQCFFLVNSSRIALSYVKQTFNVQLYQEIVTRMTEAWLVMCDLHTLYIFLSIFTF